MISSIYLDSSSNNTLSGNNASYNRAYWNEYYPGYGIRLYYSSNNMLSGNNASNNTEGISLYSSSNNTLSGNNASYNSYGIYLDSSSNNTLNDNNASYNSISINLYSSNNNMFSGNNASNNKEGIYLHSSSNNTLSDNDALYNSRNGIYLDSSSNNTLSGNNASNNKEGIYLYYSNNNMLSGNNASYNREYGIYLGSSSNNMLTNNTMRENVNNFGLKGFSDSEFDNHINISNRVDGKPIYYIRGAANTVFDSSTNAGTFYCINCVNVTIKDMSLNTNRIGIVFWNTTYSKIQNVNVSNNGYGIWLGYSSNNTLSGNNASYNSGYDYFSGIILDDYYSGDGINLYYSSNNTLSSNNVSYNREYGIYLDSSSNNTLNDNDASNNKEGIYLYSSSNNTLSGNNASYNNGYWYEYYSGHGINLYYSNNNTLSDNDALYNSRNGIYLYSSNNNMLSGNNASNNKEGIYLYSSNNNMLSGNNASYNREYGIYLGSSSNNMLTNNTMRENVNNFGLGGWQDSDFDNYIDLSNRVNGKPIYYIRGAANTVFDSSTNAGTFYCINCVNVTIKDMSLNTNHIGIFFWNTTYSKIQNVNVSNNGYGIYLDSSSNNTLSGNNVLYNSYYGIYLDSSSNNTLSGNNALYNSYYGISLYSSSNNTLNDNDASNNLEGIYLYSSSNNTLSGNNALYNYQHGIYLYYSSNNMLSGNNASYNRAYLYEYFPGYGIYLYFSSNNMLSGNNASYNREYGISLYYSSNGNMLCNNFFNNINNFAIIDSINKWNITKTPDINIIGGSYIGGNVWAHPNGTGASQTCKDKNNDGICDSPYVFDNRNIDYLPLVYRFPDVVINLSGTPVINRSTKGILSVDYWNFKASDPYNISISGGSIVYTDSGTLKGERKETIPINWTPLGTGEYIVEAKGNTTVSTRTIKVRDSNITVNASGSADYTKIQSAINASSDGDTILVESGTYFENVNVTKKLILRGIDTGGGKPVVDANGRGYAITLSAGNSTLEGFTAVNSSYRWLNGSIHVNLNNNIIKNNNASNNDVGIYLYYSSNNTISGNNVSNNYYGIELYYSSNNNLSDNIANSNNYDGIVVLYSSNNNLSDNIANSNNYTGIFMFDTRNNTLSSNNASNNNYNGIYLVYSGFNTLSNNIANSNNDNGIFMFDTFNNTLSDNNASNNYNGIYLVYSGFNTLSDNIANSNNNNGIFMFDTSDNMLSSNIINSNNDTGIYLSSSSSNLIYNNYFNNKNNAQDDGNNSWNITKMPGTNIVGGSYLGGNVWANPSGTDASQTCADADNDGICDSPYILNSNNTDYLPLAYPFLAVDINLTGIPVANQSTKDILSVDYWNFKANDPHNISITRMNDSSVVYTASGTLKGGRKETVQINWTPQDTRQYLVEVRGSTIVIVSNKTITVYDSQVISPVPELSTIALVSAGLFGLIGLARLRREGEDQ